MSTDPTNTVLKKTENQAVLTIAGSDPSGGAGIQADLKTFAAIGVYGSAAITCLTAQNSMGVESYLPVDSKFIRKQIELVLIDQPVSHIKTGMIGSAEIAREVGAILADFQGEIICDPVLRASDGRHLFEPKDIDILCGHLINKATVLTPNIPELEVITGTIYKNKKEILAAGRTLFDRFPALQALVITGGHLDEEGKQIIDSLLLRSDNKGKAVIKHATHPRIKTNNTHGTGCTFASAFTAYHLLTGDYQEAFSKAVSFMDQVINKSSSLKMGQGKGPLAHHLFQQIIANKK